VRIWDSTSGRERSVLTGHTRGVDACTISPDSSFIVSASTDNSLKVWDVASGRERATLSGHTGHITGHGISPDGSLVVSASWDMSLRIWDAGSGRERAVLVLPGGIGSVSLHPSRPMCACLDALGAVYRVDFVGVEYGPLVVTPWRRRWENWLGRCKEDKTLHLGCPACRAWLEVPDTAAGTETVCPTCGQRLKLTSSTVGSDWRLVARAWQRGRGFRAAGSPQAKPPAVP